jgi:hypothetical protein
MELEGDRKGDIYLVGGKEIGKAMARQQAYVKGKVKFILEQATKAHRGSRGIAVLFL